MSKERSTDDPGKAPDPEERGPSADLSRRNFLRLGAAGRRRRPARRPARTPRAAGAETPPTRPHGDFEEATIAELQAGMESGDLSSAELVDFYLDRIAPLDQSGPNVNSVLAAQPAGARRSPGSRDRERRRRPRRAARSTASPSCSRTTSTPRDQMHDHRRLARPGRRPGAAGRHRGRAAASRPARSSSARRTSREWANFRGFSSSSGWSGRGRPDAQPLRARPQPLRLQLRLGAPPWRPTSPPPPSAPRPTARSSARRIAQRRRRHQADRGPDQPRRRHPHLPHPGHRRPARPHGGRRRGGARRPGRRRSARSGHRGERRPLPHRLHPVPRPRRPATAPASASCATA